MTNETSISIRKSDNGFYVISYYEYDAEGDYKKDKKETQVFQNLEDMFNFIKTKVN